MGTIDPKREAWAVIGDLINSYIDLGQPEHDCEIGNRGWREADLFELKVAFFHIRQEARRRAETADGLDPWKRGSNYLPLPKVPIILRTIREVGHVRTADLARLLRQTPPVTELMIYLDLLANEGYLDRVEGEPLPKYTITSKGITFLEQPDQGGEDDGN